MTLLRGNRLWANSRNWSSPHSRINRHGSISRHIYTANELRSSFTKYFQDIDGAKHELVPSSSLIPHNDETLMFTNAGMVQFKECFTGRERRTYRRAVSSQRCVRAGGKHNDLDNVGFTSRHHTLFEMLGNFSFGDYFKEEAIVNAWKYLHTELQLDPNKLLVTVHESDKESEELWRKVTGFSSDKIVKHGDKDNFWTMGSSGPCGPCSEIFFDVSNIPGLHPTDDKWLEIWNLVFMQYNLSEDGTRSPLPMKCVDTGMGLERLASVVQYVPSNYDTDMFRNLFRTIEEVYVAQVGKELHCDNDPTNQRSRTVALRVIADHIRAITFLIYDGVVPSNVGRGYVLRRIVRRAVRYGNKLGFQGPFLNDIVRGVISSYSDIYPEMAERQSVIQSVVAREEALFFATMSRGLGILNRALGECEGKRRNKLDSSLVFTLQDTFGFPLDLTELIAKEKGVSIDNEEVKVLLENQRSLGRSSRKLSENSADDHHLKAWVTKYGCGIFTGYHSIQESANVTAIEPSRKPNQILVSIDPSPFYAEGGGQVGDVGDLITSDGRVFTVLETLRSGEGSASVLRVISSEDSVGQGEKSRALTVGEKVTASVDADKRERTSVHHTATHVLHSALRSLLGSHVMQAGSLVLPTRLRFDFTSSPVTKEQLNQLEKFINSAALAGGEVLSQEMSMVEAKKTGALSLFSEKYGSTVRVVSIPGVSTELCGGTHCKDVRSVYPFKILSESSVAGGTRRIEAVAGIACIEYLQSTQATMDRLATSFSAKAENLEEKLAGIRSRTKQLESEVKQLLQALAQAPIAPLFVKATGDTTHTSVQVHSIDCAFIAAKSIKPLLQQRLQFLRDQAPTDVHIVACGPHIVCSAPESLNSEILQCRNLLQTILRSLGGKGGGNKSFAQGACEAAVDLQKLCRAIDQHIDSTSLKSGMLEASTNTVF